MDDYFLAVSGNRVAVWDNATDVDGADVERRSGAHDCGKRKNNRAGNFKRYSRIVWGKFQWLFALFRGHERSGRVASE